jgi:hypothetical protein
VRYLLDDSVADASDEVAGDLAAWLSGSPRFASFVDAHRDKIRKKLRGATERQARGDVRAELEVAVRLLADRRIEIAFEAYGSSRRGPDFTVTFRAVHPFNLEVTRPRLDEDERPAPQRADLVATAMLRKLRQLPGDAPNAVLVAIAGPIPSQDDIVAAMRSLKLRADRRDDAYFRGRGFADARQFHLRRRRLGALLVASTGGTDARAWANPEAQRPLPDGALSACLICLGARS